MPTTASATSYGDFVGADGRVAFVDVSDQHGRFGLPSASLHNLDFPSADFDVGCSHCPNGQSAADELSLTLDYSFDYGFPYGFRLYSRFEYAVYAFGQDAWATASFSGSVFVRILELNGAPVEPLTDRIAIEYAPSAVRSVSASNTTIDLGIVEGSALIDLSGIIYDAGLSGQPNLVEVVFENRVETRHEGLGGGAFITTTGRPARFFIFDVSGLNFLSGRPQFETRAVLPEPSTGVLMLLGLGLLSSRRGSVRGSSGLC